MSATPEQIAERLEYHIKHDSLGQVRKSLPFAAPIIEGHYHEAVEGLRAAAALIRAQAERVRVLEAREQMLVDALHDVGIGGNHAALLIGSPHPLYTATQAEAEAHYAGNLDGLNAWFCWRTTMKAMREAYDTLPEDVRNAAWKRMEERRRAALKAAP